MIVFLIDIVKCLLYCDIVLNLEYDFIIIDEVYKFKNNKIKNYEFV